MPQRAINPKYVVEIPFSPEVAGESLPGTAFKLVRLLGHDDRTHPTMLEAIELITSERFSSNFLKAGRAFVINVVCRGPLLPLNASQLTGLTCFKDRPMIFHFENGAGDFCIYHRDKATLKCITIVTKVSLAEFNESEFSFELLLRALRSSGCGKFSGSLRETRLKVAPLEKEWKLMTLAVVSNNLLCIRFLQLFENFLESVDHFSMYLLQRAVENCDYDGLLAIFDLNFETSRETKPRVKKELLNVRDRNGFNLLMIAVDSKNVEATRFLLNLEHFDVNEGVDEHTSPASLACKANSSPTLLMLLQNDSKYPSNYHKLHRTQELSMFSQKLAEFHRAISAGDVRSARDFMCSLRLRHYFDERNKSAAMRAIECRQFGIYELLLLNCSAVGAHEDPSTLAHLDDDDRRRLRTLHDRYSSALFTSCVLDVSRKFRAINVGKRRLERVQFELSAALNRLYDVELFRPVLQIVAATSALRLLADFDRDSVHFLDPSESGATRGYFANDTIYVGARELLIDDRRHFFLATLIHEMTHFVVDFLYRNCCRPFVAGDEKRERDYRAVVEACKAASKRETLVDVVFGYDASLHYSELIVRPNHLLAHYIDSEEMQRASERNFPELFAFYRERIYGDMLNRLESMRGGDEAQTVNEWSRKRKYADSVHRDCQECEVLIGGSEKEKVREVRSRAIFFAVLCAFLLLLGAFAWRFSREERATELCTLANPQNEFINTRNVTSLEMIGEKLTPETRDDFWLVKEECNLLTIAIETWHEDANFIGSVVDAAEVAFEDCKRGLKTLLMSSLKRFEECQDCERVVSVLKTKLNKLLNLHERRRYLNGELAVEDVEC